MVSFDEVPLDVLWEFLEKDKRGVTLTLKIKPGSAKEKLSISGSCELTLAVRAQAVDNAANTRVREVMAEIFLLPPSKVEIMSGAKSRIKRILLLESFENLEQRMGFRGNLITFKS